MKCQQTLAKLIKKGFSQQEIVSLTDLSPKQIEALLQDEMNAIETSEVTGGYKS